MTMNTYELKSGNTYLEGKSRTEIHGFPAATGALFSIVFINGKQQQDVTVMEYNFDKPPVIPDEIIEVARQKLIARITAEGEEFKDGDWTLDINSILT